MSLDAATVLPKPPDEVLESLPEAARLYIHSLEAVVEELRSQVLDLKSQVHDLTARLSKDSSNSSKPPSSDGLRRKPKSRRGKSGKKPGGQKGRLGKGLAQVKNPDHTVVHTPTNCSACQSDLSETKGVCAEKRQVFDISKPQVVVTEHQVEKKICPCCGKTCKASFPADIRGWVQYGGGVQALASYFAHQHFIPVDRVTQILKDLFGLSISPGCCAKIDKKLFKALAPFEADLKAYLLKEKTLHFDETGMRCEKKLHWVHVASSSSATLYAIHRKRGREAIDQVDILPQFRGNAVHDHWMPYFSYERAIHALCNAHHLRELDFVHEVEHEAWANEMKDLLIWANKETEHYLDLGELPKHVLSDLEEKYAHIVTTGMAYHASLSPLPRGKRGKQKQRAGKNLLDRLQGKRECVLRFAHNFEVPFTNNQGEQDIRMVKLKEKISGCFRTFEGGETFCRIRSYISTTRKQGRGVWDALMDALANRPQFLSQPQLADP